MKTPTPEQLQYMFEHAQDTKVPGLIACSVICIVAASLAVLLRFVARHSGKIKLRWSDWLILIALIFLYVYTAAVLCTIPYGMGRHVILVKDPKRLAIWMLVAETTLTLSVMAIKLSFCCLYVQIFPLKWIKQAGIVISLIVTAYTIAHIVSDLLQCIPLAALWDPTITDAKCYPFTTQMMVMGIINISTDVAISFACIVSVVRIFYVIKMGSSDPTWNDVEAGEISNIEPTIGIIAACLPACRLLLNRMFKTSIGLSRFYSQPQSLQVVRTDDFELSDNKTKVEKTKTSSGNLKSTTLDDEERLVSYGNTRT
ncbi:hypothetical protein CC80DRAFT_545575 [Byssothecium circinans]|uniref:Rhodopsin domain-containing protein n=1 Tax=Byssothecium circinans TaxID=147558 RepID=A0A6A5UDK4_9PLEO|nr:hypothetical protein CC80DRAFT_545575 [Byssothecium circinans]